MSEQRNADANRTIINRHDEGTLPPPKLEVGLVGWLRQNLFGSPADAVVTILSSLLILVLVYGFFDWSVRTANWFTVINNQRLFMMESFEPEFEWRLALTVLLSALLTGISLAAWARRSWTVLAGLSVTLLAALALLPPIIDALIPQPLSYFTAGNVEIVDRASTLTPQHDLAFIAQAGETVSLRLALDEVADIETLSNLAGFSDRVANALANAAHNRLDRQVITGETFDRMVSGELTEGLEERTRLNIRTFTRTNDMLTSTAQYVETITGRLTATDGTVAELRLWLGRLERAALGLDPREDAILAALEAVEDGATTLSMSDRVPAVLHDAIAELTARTLASEQLEDLGEMLILQLSEDLIGQPDQSNDDEELITPLPREAAFLRDMWVRLLTPQSVLDLYQLGQTPMSVAIRDAQTYALLAETVLSEASDSVSFDVPADGWYILSKDAVAGETGTAILAADGIHPIVERTLSATESRFVRLTDNELVISDSRPQIDGKSAPFVVLIDNQFRGLRDLKTYLVHFIPPFFEQAERLLLPFFMTLAWGFALGRALAHMSGENSIFNSTSSRLSVLAWSTTPLLVLLAYFVLLDGAAPIQGAPAVVLKIAAAVGVVLLVRYIENWLSRANPGEDAEGSLSRFLMYGWGAFPFLMYLMVSGVSGLSGGALGSIVGGLIWLLLMYFIGLNYRNALGYALLIGGFFAQILQSFVVNLVWEGWNSEAVGAIVIWLVIAAIGVFTGQRGAALRGSLTAGMKRYGYLISCIAFLFIFVDTNTLADGADGSATLLAGLAVVFWLAWMFFSGATRWSSNRIIIGLLLLTFLWMQSWTMVDRWSTIYFVLWLTAGALTFKRGERAQSEPYKAEDMQRSPIYRRYSIQGMLAAAGLWLAALLLLPSLIAGLNAQGILQTSPQELLPLSDKRIWGGLMLTMQLTILGVGASFPIGLALALGRRSNLPVVKYACILYIEVVRGVPLITVLFLAVLMVPLVDPTLASIENAVRAWVGITLFSAAYLAENVRGGLQSIDRGQTEAAQAVGLSTWQTTLHILLPQALRAVIPALVGQFISLFKDTSLVFIVGLAEIVGIANRVVAQAEFLGRRQETFLYVAILFFVFSYIMSYISRKIEATGSGAIRAQQL